jgi:tRNA threonylcarbamoyladenosine biosynthesis protein TsaE
MQDKDTSAEKSRPRRLRSGVTSRSPEETDRIAGRFAAGLKPGDVVCLHGDLGAGKTRFVKGVASFFGVPADIVNSPTFTLINEYSGEPDIELYHFDCYRIVDVREALEIGAEEYFYGTGICLIEWAEKIEPIIPPDAMHITIEKISPTERQFLFKPPLE